MQGYRPFLFTPMLIYHEINWKRGDYKIFFKKREYRAMAGRISYLCIINRFICTMSKRESGEIPELYPQL